MLCADARSRIRRFRGHGVSGLELWNRPLGEDLFWERVGAPRVDRLRGEGWSEAEVGRDQAESVAMALADLHQEIGFDRAFVGGGLLEVEGFTTALQASGLPCPVRLGHGGSFAGEAGGLALLDSLDLPGGIVLDVGQTAIKASSGRTRTVRPRDPASLPLELIDPAGSRPRPSRERVEAAAAFVRAAVHDLLARSATPQPAVVLALPCPLDDGLLPGGCTYGWEGDPSLVPALADALADALGTKALEVLVLNDAELVAESARLDLQPAPGDRVLCLTLGFGPGGALLAG